MARPLAGSGELVVDAIMTAKPIRTLKNGARKPLAASLLACGKVTAREVLAKSSRLRHLPLKGGGRRAQRAGRGSLLTVGIEYVRCRQHKMTPTRSPSPFAFGSGCGDRPPPFRGRYYCVRHIICDSPAACGEEPDASKH